jgi:hypothetical protein
MTKPEISTTHAGWGEGRPRLIIVGGGDRTEVALQHDVTRIGSGPDADIRLDGIGTVAGEVVHDEMDEYVLVPHEPAQTSARPEPMGTVTGQDGVVLRTGARFALGSWSFVYMRDEFADHGRPYGGREGGEGEHQRSQPERPDYSAEVPETDAESDGRRI